MMQQRWRSGEHEPLLANLGDELKARYPAQFRCAAGARAQRHVGAVDLIHATIMPP
jgi:hypothetical protein